MDMYDILLARYLGAGGGGGGGGDKDANADVVFLDYDGTVVKSYSKEEFLVLTAMPANPSHDGLTGQGWNYSLTDAKAYVTKYGKIRIGQMYIPSDGKTRIKIKLEEGRLEPVLGLGINGSVDVDWGDDTAHGTMTGSDVSTLVQLQHVYASAGEYTIALGVTGNIAFLGDSTYYAAILRKEGVTSATANESLTYQNAIQEVYIGSGVTSIGEGAFNNCCSLSSVTIPDSVISIGAQAFSGCYTLTSITIPDGMASIGEKAFVSCYSLASITIPDSVASIGSYAFYNCHSLISITIPDSVTSIGERTFYNCYSLTHITIPDSVISIGSNTFNFCSLLISVNIPHSVTSIGDTAFGNCSSLISLNFPDSVTSISNNVFYACYSLISVNIPDSVTSISNYAFNNCSSLASIKFKGSTPPTVSNSNAFQKLPTDCIIYVPASSLTAYKSAANYPNPDVYTYVEY